MSQLEDHLNTKKSVHIAFPVTVHRLFKARLAENGLSMQEFFIEVASQCVEKEPAVNEIVKALKERKINGIKSRRRIVAEQDELYDILESDDVF